jgi:hypothetical protein
MASTPKTPKKRVAKKTGPAAAKSAVVDAPKTIEKIVKDKDIKEKPEIKEHKIEVKEAKQENKELKFEGKEHKNEKIEIKEKPEIKEHGKVEKFEIKEHKIEKLEKEHGKEGGKIEIKDGGKENVKIEVKEHPKENFKEVIDKNTPENPKDLVENPGRPIDTGDPAVSTDLAQRVANLEGQLATFISGANRPDLSTGALKNEAAPAAKPKKR